MKKRDMKKAKFSYLGEFVLNQLENKPDDVVFFGLTLVASVIRGVTGEENQEVGIDMANMFLREMVEDADG